MSKKIQEQLEISAESELNNKFRIKGLPDYWQNYFVCVLFHMFLPLLPITIEYWQNGIVSEKSLTLVAAMYTITIGISSRNMLLFGLTVVASLTYGVAYGIAVGQNSSLPLSGTLAFFGIMMIFIIHSLERYNRHVVERAPFLEFIVGGD